MRLDRDGATNETGFVIQRAPVTPGPDLVLSTPTDERHRRLRPADRGRAERQNRRLLHRRDRGGKGNGYQYRVSAVNATAQSAWAISNIVAVPAAPAAPSGVVATAFSHLEGKNARVTLTWTNFTNETGYTIQRATNVAFTAVLTSFTVGQNVPGGTSATWLDTPYYFRVHQQSTVTACRWVVLHRSP